MDALLVKDGFLEYRSDNFRFLIFDSRISMLV